MSFSLMTNREVCIHLFAAPTTKIRPQVPYNFVHHLVHIAPQIQQNVLFGKKKIVLPLKFFCK